MNLLKRLFSRTKSAIPVETIDASGNNSLQVADRHLSDLSPDVRLATIMSLGDTGELRHYDLLKQSILSDPDPGIRFAALKRIHLLQAHADLIPFLRGLQATPDNRRLEPYLAMTLHRAGLITAEELQSRLNGS